MNCQTHLYRGLDPKTVSRRRFFGMVARRARKLYRFSRMKRAAKKPDWLTPEVQKHLKRVEYEFQVREFGEEMARINFLPSKERKRQVGEMVDHARRKGVSFEKPALGVTE